jgi:hypothetical protein
MKKLILAFLLSPIFIFSQDLIMLKNGEELSVKITDVSEDIIKYKKLNFLDGPNFNVKTSEIFLIKFSNGEKQLFNTSNSSSSSDLPTGSYSEISEGTVVALYSARSLTSKSLAVGSMVEFRVKDAVVDENNYVLIKANQIVYATVNEAVKARALGKKGMLNFMIQNIKAIDGTNVPAYLNLGSDGKNRAGTAIGVGMLLFWPALFVKGKEAKFKAGTIVNASISENRKIKINKNYKSSSSPSVNTEYIPPVMTEEDCGKEPKNINPFSKKPFDRMSREYRSFKKNLDIWNQCMGN